MPEDGRFRIFVITSPFARRLSYLGPISDLNRLLKGLPRSPRSNNIKVDLVDHCTMRQEFLND